MPGRIILEIESEAQILPQGAHAICHELLRDSAHDTLHNDNQSTTFPFWTPTMAGWKLEIASPNDSVLLNMLRQAELRREVIIGSTPCPIFHISTEKLRWSEITGHIPELSQLSLDFMTPTFFRKAEINVPLPLPELIAQSVLRHCPQEISNEFQQHIQSIHLAWAENICTQSLNIGNKRITGFTGKVGLGSRSIDGRRLLRLIRRMSPYIHVGAKGAYGLGHINSI